MTNFRVRRGLVFVAALLSLTGPVSSFGQEPFDKVSPTAAPIELGYGFKIKLVGTPQQILRLKRWIDEISRVPKGNETLWAISRTQHTLTIFHSHHAVISSGRAGALMTANLYNGRGEDVEIKFNAEIPDHGSHWVFDRHRNPIEYTAVQNLYHEFAHAMHMMTGTWQYSNSEGSAIREENIFRRELARSEDREFIPRGSIHGRPICPGSDATKRVEAYEGLNLIC